MRKLNATKYEKWYVPVIDKRLFDIISSTFTHETGAENNKAILPLTGSELTQIYEFVKDMWEQLESISWQKTFEPFATRYNFEVFRSGLSKLAFDESDSALFYSQLTEKLIFRN